MPVCELSPRCLISIPCHTEDPNPAATKRSVPSCHQKVSYLHGLTCRARLELPPILLLLFPPFLPAHTQRVKLSVHLQRCYGGITTGPKLLGENRSPLSWGCILALKIWQWHWKQFTSISPGLLASHCC